MDRTVLLFTLVMTIGVGILFGIAPALRASKADLATELKENGRGSVGASRQGLRSLLVSAEVALSLVLLISTGLMMQSLARLQNVDKGFQGERVLTADISLPAIRYDTKGKSWGFFQQLLERIENLPGTRQASLTNIIPLQGNSWERRIWPEGVPTERETGNSVLYHMISPGHFSVLGIPILKGRGFEDRDRDGAPLVAVIDESMAEKFWPGEDPIGKRVTFETEESDSESRLYRTVIGVAKNVRHYELENPSRIQVYVNMEQSGRSWTRSMAIMVQTSGNPLTMTDLVRQELAGLDPEVPLAEIETVEGYVDNALSGPRVIGGLLSIFSTMALVLSAVGVFGVMSYSVVQRLPEIGIRMALGAKAADVVRMVVRKGLSITLAGVVAGLAGAFALTRFIGGVLFEVDPLDPTTYGVVALFLILVSSAAAYLPARRATRTDPTMVLRGE